MKAAILHGPSDLRVEEAPTPWSPAPHEAVIKIEYAAICGTDLHAYRGTIPVKTPVILGHEYAGRILQVGRGVRAFKVGDKVIGPYAATCGACRYCAIGKPQLCERRILFGLNFDGAFAQFMRVPHADRSLVKLPDGMDFKTGVLIPDMLLTALYAVERGEVGLGSTVLVAGLGAIGLSAIIASKVAGASTVIGVDTRDETLKLAKDLGADYTINSEREKDILTKVRELTEGLGVDVALGLRGSPSVIASTLDMVRPFGKYVQVAIARPGELNLRYVTSLEKTIIGALNPASKVYMRRAINVVKAYNLDLQRLVSHEFTLDGINKAFEIADKKIEDSIKIVIRIT